MGQPDTDEAPRPASIRDLGVLIGWLADFEGYLMADNQDPELTDRFRDRFVRAGLLSEHATNQNFRQAINDMNHRLRYVIGEYPVAPAQLQVPPSRRPNA